MSAIAPLPVPLPSTHRLEVHREQMVIEGHALEDVALAGTLLGSPLGTAPVVRVVGGSVPLRVFLCTDPTQPVRTILETYAGRWAIEVLFRDLKQQLGFADSSARKKAAVERTAPFVGYIYTVLVLWFADSAYHDAVATPPIRPWYTHKRGFSFADVLRAAQRTLAPLDVLDPARSLDDLHELRAASAARDCPRRANAPTKPAARVRSAA